LRALALVLLVLFAVLAVLALAIPALGIIPGTGKPLCLLTRSRVCTAQGAFLRNFQVTVVDHYRISLQNSLTGEEKS
jgi:hypothetical protein